MLFFASGVNIYEMFFRANNSIEMPTELTRSDKKLKKIKVAPESKRNKRKTIEKVTARSLGEAFQQIETEAETETEVMG